MKTLKIDADAYARLVDSHGRLVRAVRESSNALCREINGEERGDNELEWALLCLDNALAAAERIGDA